MVEAIKAKKQIKKVWIGKERVSHEVLSTSGQASYHNHNQQGWKERLRLRGTNVIFSPDSKLIATIDENIVQVWDSTGELRQTLKGHQDSVYSVVFSPDGKEIATASYDKWEILNICWK